MKAVANALPGLRADGQIVIELDRMSAEERAQTQAGLIALGLRPTRVLHPRRHAAALKSADLAIKPKIAAGAARR